MPKWVGVMWAALIVCCFSVGFYYFSVRPYAYRWRACNGYRDYGVCIPSNYAMHGIDISHHQGDIDWRRLATARQSVTPLSFVFLKATEGGDHADTAFAANFDSAKQAGFVRGAYHFYIPSTDALKQADFFINTVRLDSGDLAPVLDVELPGKSGKGRKEELARGVKQWLDRVEAHYGVKPILYTSYKFKTRYLNDTIFDAYPYWIAHYYVDSVQYRGRWHFWQHTDRGRVPGIDEDVDLNIFNGTAEEMDALRIQRKL
jgi:lysozyme